MKTEPPSASSSVLSAVRHAFLWLVAGNAIGVMIAVLLLLPALNVWLGEWTYGRWMMVHMNVLLFGWCALPMVGILFVAYGATSGRLAAWCRPVVWLWSAALAAGAVSWLEGHSSGKLFLDWSGFVRVFFPFALGALWLLLATSLALNWRAQSRAVLLAKCAGLLVLLAVPFALYFASNPNVYPAVNPDTGGPIGSSQLDSSLGMVFILLAMPFALTRMNPAKVFTVRLAWMVLAANAIFCATLTRTDISHRLPSQYLGLGTILVWLPLAPAYYNAFQWIPATKRWRRAFLLWWGALVVSGWILFLPGILDRFKFTDGLVGHSLTAVAGFLTAYLLFAITQLVGECDASIVNGAWAFYAWNLGVLSYVVLFMIAGWIEGADPAFTMAPSLARNIFYIVRLLTGLAMLAASVEWLLSSFSPRISLVNEGEKAA